MIHTHQWAMAVITVSLFFGLVGCSATSHCHDLSPHKRGLPGQSIDAVVQNIQEHAQGEDTIGTHPHKMFQVYMTPLPDDTGQLSDAGLVTLKGDAS